MGIITEIREDKKRGKRVSIYIDGHFALTVDLEIAVKEKLRVDTELDSERITELGELDLTHRCYETAVRFLGYRPRSESELRDRLVRRGFTAGIIETVINSLAVKGLINDDAFARFWTENRESFSPRSRYLTHLELRKKGVAEDVINNTVEGIDDEESAYHSALNRVSRLTITDRRELYKKLGDYLRRRGFSYEIVNRTVEKIWQERGQ